MSKRVILKLKQNGKDFGYVRLKKDIFYSGGKKDEAVVFELEKYKDTSDTFYYKVADTKKGYMDVKFSTSRVQVVEPWMSVESSTICAWKLENETLRMILSKKETGKKLSSGSDTESKALYANLYEGEIFNVYPEAPGKISNKANIELEHAII